MNFELNLRDTDDAEKRMRNDENKHLISRIHALSSLLLPRPTGAVAVTDPLPGIRALLFDIYGTLVISASGDIGLAGNQDEEIAFHAALAAAGVEAPAGKGPADLKAAIRAFHTERRSAGVQYPEVDIRDMWFSVLGSGAGLERLAVEYEGRVNPVWPMPGLAEVLARIRDSGLVLGIVSNAQFYTPPMLEAFLDSPLTDVGFDPECCAFSYCLLEAKPSTRIYQEALDGLERKHGISPPARSSPTVFAPHPPPPPPPQRCPSLPPRCAFAPRPPTHPNPQAPPPNLSPQLKIRLFVQWQQLVYM